MSLVTPKQDITDIDFPSNLEPIRLLGHGSMASVYLARDKALRRMVAVKILKPELCEIEQAGRRFEREAQAAARLSHDNVATVYSVGRIDGDRPYIEMQYVDGSNLEQLLRSRGVFDVAEACEVLAQVASALAAAHERNIVHRDVKPANILVGNSDGIATLTDFGIAAILQAGDDDLTRLTREGERPGDPRYMSPEQLRGEPLTGQSDVYGLGVVAFELLTGKGPFDDAEIGSMAAAHIRRPAPDLSLRRPDIPQALSEIVQRCLAKKSEHRPRAKDLARLLRDPTSDSESASPPAGPVPAFFHELKQRKVYQAAAAYAAIIFVLLQAIDLLLQPWPQLDVVYQATVIASLAGFPVTIVLAWIYDLRHGRLVRTDRQAIAEADSAAPAQRRWLMLLGLSLSVGIALAAAWWLLN